MDSAFQYYRPVTGKYFVGRALETRIFVNMLSQGENVVIYEPPKTGRKSLVQQGFFNMKMANRPFVPVNVSLLDIRSLEAFAMRLATAVFRTAGSNHEEYARAAREMLSGTHFCFDTVRFDTDGEVLSATGPLDDGDLRAAFLLPYRTGLRTGVQRIVVLDEFQNIMLTEDGERACHLLEEVFRTLPGEYAAYASYVFLGSSYNAMDDIFGIRRFFWRQAGRIRLPALESKDIIDHIVKGFLATGKVVDRDLLLGVCKLFRGNIWYINHLCAVCDSLTKGYIMEQTLTESLSALIAVHEPRFTATMNGLTTFQLSLLRAILEGNTRFSSAEIIRKYDLNSSANVRRLKDALCKKEIVTFDENDNPIVLDPLFEYWAKKTYFNISI